MTIIKIRKNHEAITISDRQDPVSLYWNYDRLEVLQQDQLHLVQRLRLMFLV